MDYAIAKALADHDPVDITRVEVFGGGLDAERPHDSRPLTERDRKCRICAAAADQKHSCIAKRIDRRDRRARGLAIVQSTQNRRMQGANAHGGANTWREAAEVRAARR